MRRTKMCDQSVTNVAVWRRCMQRLLIPLTVVLMSSTVGVAACGGDDTSGEQGADASLAAVKVGFIPAIDNAYLWRAEDAGYFRDEGLDVTLQPMAGGAEITPALVGGSIDMGISDSFSLLQARSKGLDVKFVLWHRFQTPKSPDLWVMVKDPAISGPHDLVGKKLTTNLLNNLVDLADRAWLQESGVDAEDVDIIEVGFPDANQALESGSVDAITTLEPFKTIGEQQGFRVVGKPLDAVAPDPNEPVVVGGLTTTGEFLNEEPEVVEAMVTASRRAFEDLADPAILRETLVKHAEISKDVAQKVTPIDYDNPVYDQPVSGDPLEPWKALGVRADLLPADLDLAQAVGEAK